MWEREKGAQWDKKYIKFDEAKQLINARIAFAIKNTIDLEQHLLNFATNPRLKEKTDNACTLFVKENSGATEKIYTKIKKHLWLLK